MKDQLVDNRTKYGLEDFAISQIISILKSNPKIEKVILFGSRAKGNFQNGSDVDLSIKGNGLALNDILDASIEIDELALPYKFDLVIYDRIKEKSLLDHIDRVGIILFERDSEGSHDIVVGASLLSINLRQSEQKERNVSNPSLGGSECLDLGVEAFG